MKPSNSRTSKRAFAAVATGVLCFLFASGVVGHEGHEPLPTKGVQLDLEKGTLILSPDAQKGLALKTTPVELKPRQETVLAYARLVLPWESQVFVSSTIGGRIAALHVQPGEMITAGALLAEITSPELEAMQQELRQAAVNRELSRQTVERMRSLSANQAIAGRELIDAESKLKADENAVRTARVQLETLGIDTHTLARIESGDVSETTTLAITAPIGGVVNHSDLAIGKVIAANEHLFEIADLSRIWVRIEVLEQDIWRIQEGQQLQLSLVALPGKTFSTTVTVPTVAVDPQTHLGTAWAELRNENPESPTFLPGFYGTVTVQTGTSAKLPTIPASALQGVGAERYVLVETASTAKAYEYRKQSVVVASANSKVVQLESGALFPGDRVVTTGSHVLSSLFFLESLRLSPEGAKNIGLKLAWVEPRVVESVLEFDGTLELPPESRATVSAQIDGRLERIYVSPGKTVQKGDVVAEIASPLFQETQLKLLQAELEVELAQTTLKRLQDIGGGTTVIAKRRLQEVESQLKSAIANRDGIKRQLIVSGMQEGDIAELLANRRPVPAMQLRSPVNGRVVQFDKTLGQMVTADEPILVVHDPSRLWVRGNLNEQDAARVQRGTTVRVRLTADPTRVIPGKVVRSTRMLTADARTLVVWIELDENAGVALQQNMLARITATLAADEKHLAVPHDALIREGTRTYVFIQGKGGKFERRQVETGKSDDRWVTIRGGIDQGTIVAIHGSAGLQTSFASVR
jgi:membrane fusion protein, heavy metal efflux system